MKKFILSVSLLLVHLPFISSQANEADSLAMVDFYYAMDGDNWKYNTNWLSATPLAEWYGLSVVNGRVTSISVRNNFCSGYVNSSLGNCTALRSIYFQENEINGIADFDSLHQLIYVNISSNELTEFPSFLLKCQNLERLNLYRNSIDTNLPVEIDNLTKLTRLTLSENQLSGVVQSMRNLKNLTVLDLSLNQELEGDLKDILTDSLPLLTLSFSKTKISGEILPSYFNEESNDLRLFADSSMISGLDQLDSLGFSKIWIRHTDMGFNQLLTVQQKNIIDQYYYNPQNLVTGPADMNVALGSNFALTCNIEGAEDYQWYKGGQVIQGEKAVELEIQNFELADTGAYYCTGNHSALPDLTIKQSPTNINIGTTSTHDQSIDKIKLYPNPATNMLTLGSLDYDSSPYFIHSTSGALIDNGFINQDKVNIEHIDPGFYILVVNRKDSFGNIRMKFIKQ